MPRVATAHDVGVRLTQRCGNRPGAPMPIDAAAMELGLTQVLSSVAHQAIRQRRLVPVLVDYTCEGPGLFFAYPPHRQASARLRVFGDFLQGVFTQIEGDWHDIVDTHKQTRNKPRGRSNATRHRAKR